MMIEIDLVAGGIPTAGEAEAIGGPNEAEVRIEKNIIIVRAIEATALKNTEDIVEEVVLPLLDLDLHQVLLHLHHHQMKTIAGEKETTEGRE